MAVIYALLRVRLNNVRKIFVHEKYSNHHRRNRHYFSANGPFLLLPLALKWGLFILLAIVIVPCIMAKGAYAASLTVEVPKEPLSITVSADDAAKESSQANVKVSSDAYWGYTLSVKSDSSDGSLTSGTNKLKTTTDDVTDLDNNSWGFKFGKDTVSGNYHKGPTTTTATQIDKTAGQTGQKEENSYAFTIGARVDNTQAAGNYTGQFTFMITANAVDYTITYNLNGGSTGSETATGKSIEQTVQVASTTPTNNDKTFIGWCSQQPTDKGGCKGKVYYPSDDYTLSSGDNNLALYALWDGLDMQNWEGCNTLRMSTAKQDYQITLIDSRDKKPYYVAKLADGNCWMTENLDLDIVAGHTYTTADTDLAYATNEEKGTSVDDDGNYQWTPKISTSTVLPLDNTSTRSLFSFNPGDYCWNGVTTPPFWTPSDREAYIGEEWFQSHSVECQKHVQKNGVSLHYHLGNYYSFDSAVAQDDTSTISNEHYYNTSICPAGWQLPRDTGEPSIQSLANKFTVAGKGKPYIAPYWFTPGGWVNQGIRYYAGAGYYMTNAAKENQKFTHFHWMTTNDSVYPLLTEGKHEVILVRCLARL